MENVPFLRWQGFSCQLARLSIQAGYESYFGITHMHLVKTAANADVFDLWEGKKGRCRDLMSVENTKGAAQTSSEAHQLLDGLWRC